MNNFVIEGKDGFTESARARNTLRSAGQILQEKGRLSPNSRANGSSASNKFSVSQTYQSDTKPLGAVLPRLAKRKTTTNSIDSKVMNTDSSHHDFTRPNLLIEHSEGPDNLEALRTADIYTDANSAASQAFIALKNRRPSSASMIDIPKKVEGREIRQDHHLYGMTYGMMLGIRVLVIMAYLFAFA
jgi:hypothetical protein